MRDPIDELVAEVARKRTSAETFSDTARQVFLAALPDLEGDTVDALERSGRAFVADVRGGGITMWRLTEEAPELSLPERDDVEELVWIGFLAVAAGRISPLEALVIAKRPDESATAGIGKARD